MLSCKCLSSCRRMRRMILLLIGFLAISFVGRYFYLSYIEDHREWEIYQRIIQSRQSTPSTKDDRFSRTLKAADLLARPLATNRLHVPRLIHQSWMSTNLPGIFQQW